MHLDPRTCNFNTLSPSITSVNLSIGHATSMPYAQVSIWCSGKNFENRPKLIQFPVSHLEPVSKPILAWSRLKIKP